MAMRENGKGMGKRSKKCVNEKAACTKKKKCDDGLCDAYLCQHPDEEKQLKNISWISCDECQNWFHLICMGLKKAPKGKFMCGCTQNLCHSDIKDLMDFSFKEERFREIKIHFSKLREHKTISLRQQLYEKRHKTVNSKHLRFLASEFGALTGRQYILRSREIQKIVEELWPSFDSFGNNRYIAEVLVMEGLVYAFQIIFYCNRSLASRILAECRVPVEEDEDSDSD